ncbi:Dynein light chain roadblock-type 2 [Spironucleus salmonicida]|uniref:Dynein light chain roadblock-type 2 n=1 Tax=Spironucleus salmonicida TaxID=348837 RepID=V6LY40_9EUKA|nr:Dynein light chain roadblock-type 2 [Spironucleus salmonicida]|eukprot:EST49485.1 Dynein light chain roadblock-type 2 [Spironucleus salmonicida]
MDIFATIKRISSHESVDGVLILQDDGNVLHSSFEQDADTSRYAKLVLPLGMLACSSIRDVDPVNELQYARIGSMNKEINIVPQGKYFVVTVCSVTDQE